MHIFCSQKGSVNRDFAVLFFFFLHLKLQKKLSCNGNLSCSETVTADMKMVGPVPLLDSIVVLLWYMLQDRENVGTLNFIIS